MNIGNVTKDEIDAARAEVDRDLFQVNTEISTRVAERSF